MTDKTGHEEFAGAVPENSLKLYDIKLARTAGMDGGYMYLEAEKADFDNDNHLLLLYKADLQIDDGVNIFTSNSDKGSYIINESLTAEGNISGVWNGMDYSVSPDGIFIFDFIKEKGKMGEGVIFKEKGSVITAKELYYDAVSKTFFFSNDVSVLFIGGEW